MNEQATKEIKMLFEKLTYVFKHGATMSEAEISKLYHEIYTENCDYIVFNGDHLKGITQNIQTHVELFTNGMFRGARLITESFELRFIDAHTALVHSTGAIQLRWQKKVPKSRRSVQTTVCIYDGAAWKITAFHNSRIMPINPVMRLIFKLFSKKL